MRGGVVDVVQATKPGTKDSGLRCRTCEWVLDGESRGSFSNESRLYSEHGLYTFEYMRARAAMKLSVPSSAEAVMQSLRTLAAPNKREWAR